MSINALYRRHIAGNEMNKGLLQALLVLGDKIEAQTGTHPDAAWATFDPHTGAMILNEKDYSGYGNLTTTGDLLEELITRIENWNGGGGGGGGSLEILRSASDLEGEGDASYTWGYNYSLKKLYVKNSQSEWEQVEIVTSNTNSTTIQGNGFDEALQVFVKPPQYLSLQLNAQFEFVDAQLDTDHPLIISPSINAPTVINGIDFPIPGRTRTVVNDTEHLVILQESDLVDPDNAFKTGYMSVFLCPSDSVTFQAMAQGWTIINSSRGSAFGAFDTFSDFYGGPQPFGVRVGNGGSHGPDSFATVQGTNGIYRIDTGAIMNGWASLGYSFSGYTPGASNGPALYVARFSYENSLANHEMHFGIHNGGAAAPTNGFYFRVGDNNGNVISVIANDNNVPTEIITGYFLTEDYFELGVFINKAMDEATFFLRQKGSGLGWELINTITLPLDFSTVTPQLLLRKLSGTAGVKVHCDWMGNRLDMKRHL